MSQLLSRWSLGVCALLSTPVWADAPPAVPGLELVAEAHLRPAGGLQVKATFRSAKARFTLFVPEFYGSNGFPGWRLVREDGATFEPYQAPFQTMWTDGMQGSLVEIQPGQDWSVEHAVDLVLATGPRAGPAADLTPLLLPPGRYRVLCRHEHARAEVPVGGPDFTLTQRKVEGLWTGKLEAAAVEVLVPRPAVVSLNLEAPRDLVPGTPYLVGVRLRNDTPSTVTLCGALVFSASSKPHGTFRAGALLGPEAKALGAGEAQSIVLEPGVEQRFVVDLARLSFAGGRPAAPVRSLAEALGDGMFAFEASFEPADKGAPLAATGLWRYVARPGQPPR